MKLFFAAVLFIALTSGFMGKNLMKVMAEEESELRYNKYYTSIRLNPGDTLWTIADQYNVNSEKSMEEYVRELRHMNSLTDDQIHVGHYLTVSYYAPASE